MVLSIGCPIQGFFSVLYNHEEAAYEESRTTTKMSMAEKNAAKAQSDAYLQSLATKYNGKPAIQASRSGVTFDAPKSKVKEERK